LGGADYANRSALALSITSAGRFSPLEPRGI